MNRVKTIGNIVTSDLDIVSLTIWNRILSASGNWIVAWVTDCGDIYATYDYNASAVYVLSHRPAQLVGVYASSAAKSSDPGSRLTRRHVRDDLLAFRHDAARRAA